jgi:hypothetical protein
MQANRGTIDGYKAREKALRERGAGWAEPSSPHGGVKEVGDSDTSETRSPQRVSEVSETSETLKAFAARDRLVLQLQSGARVLQDIREDLVFAAAEAAALAEAVTALQAHLQQQKQMAETLQAKLKAGRGAGRETAGEGAGGETAGEEEGRKDKEIEKLRRDLAVAKKRLEREEKLAAERGADIEDLTERLKAMQSASR